MTDDSDIDVVFGDETITLHYEEDLDDLATIRTDRTGVPENGQVHVTVSDFRLNLDPTGADVWVMNTDGELASLVLAPPTTTSQLARHTMTESTGLPPLAAWAESSQLPMRCSHHITNG